ncbi:DNA sulfur modification protein DndB [Desulfovibrio mangrovi]|uniref:DNA sulfur modification protein DndB n=1 Tax=Desulfovibrio mangrovi TaxID=2976983 RepID=UPI00224817EB|nr:DNA sulfur modification protein DndB [Desulfovibrio mangrovi]UZP69211.1 DNA sulfur modification protein DndB [Desulfovibrio mangrovi]
MNYIDFHLQFNHLPFMKKTPSTEFTYSFPAIRGIQAGREYYVTMCPLKLVPRLFKFVEDDLPPELRAQRSINKQRIPALARYIIENKNSYAFSSLTVSIDGEVFFTSNGEDNIGRKLGVLSIPMEARFLINDGQHRRAAIEEAIQEYPELGEESISVVFFVDAGLERSQQMFADLNRYAVRTTRSLGILYDHREPISRLAKKLADNVPVFIGMTEKEKTTISNRSRKLFTLSSIYQATKQLLQKGKNDNVSRKEEQLAHEFWKEVSHCIPDWLLCKQSKVSAHELRAEFIHAHGIALQALAIAGSSLITRYPDSWQKEMTKLRDVDWSRRNLSYWEGRALIGGRLSKAKNNVVLTANAIKRHLNLPLDPKEQEVEDSYVAGRM